ncbi:MAG TPA: ABC transporter permease [Puia sp.]|nr:ABC transporter permease [Puia sp.]
MFKNYIRVTLRVLRRNSIYSMINIAGLAIGLTVFWLMALYIIDELGYDRDSVNADRIYRVVQSGTTNGGSFKLAITPPSMGPALKKDYPEIEATARVDAEGGGTLIYGDKKITAGDMFFADSSLLTIFRFPLLAGDPEHALSAPHSIILTRTLAEKLFGNAEAALNKTLTVEHDAPALVTGVMEDRPANSHLHFSALRSMYSPVAEGWLNAYLYTYVLLDKNADAHRLESRFPEFFERYLKSPMGKGASLRLDLQPVDRIHLHSALDYEISRNGDIRYIWLFAAVALLVLGIAVINYINLATARSSVRLKEIGVRKVIGSSRKQLMAMFMTESVFLVGLSSVIAWLLTRLLLPVFNQLSGKALVFDIHPMTQHLLIPAAFALFIGVAGGLYPALFLSRCATIPSLKGQQGDQSSTILFRKTLVTFQFVITIFLIAGSAIIYLQLRYMQHRDLGFNKDQVLAFHLSNPGVRQHIEELKTRLLNDPSVEAAAAAGNPIGNNDIGTLGVRLESSDGSIAADVKKVQSFYVDADWLATMQIGLREGRNFSAGQVTDRDHSVLVNETLVKEAGWKNAVGKRVILPIGEGGKTDIATIIGVTNDFNIYSLQHQLEPIVLEMPPVLREEDNVYVRVNPLRVTQALKHIADVFHGLDPASPLEFHFLDENFSQQYAAERKQGTLLLIFTVLAIIIACLGLLGLVTFSVGQRTKEIGIRKVLGAGELGIVLLVSRDLIKPVVMAILIATPLTWYMMHRWLESFAYRVSVSVWVVLGAGVLAVAIAMFTVGMRAYRAARANPAHSLKNE